MPLCPKVNTIRVEMFKPLDIWSIYRSIDRWYIYCSIDSCCQNNVHDNFENYNLSIGLPHDYYPIYLALCYIYTRCVNCKCYGYFLTDRSTKGFSVHTVTYPNIDSIYVLYPYLFLRNRRDFRPLLKLYWKTKITKSKKNFKEGKKENYKGR